MANDMDSAVGGLTFTDNISLTWKPVEYQPDEAHLALVNESNDAFLRAVSAIGEFSREVSEEDAGMSQEIARLDLKVNLLLDLVSQLIYKQLDIPEKSRVTLSGSEIEWYASDLPAPGLTVFVQAYVQHGTPKPLCFYGKVASSQEEHDSGRARVRYVGLCGSAQSWLEKLIFRHHRREIAFKKLNSNIN